MRTLQLIAGLLLVALVGCAQQGKDAGAAAEDEAVVLHNLSLKRQGGIAGGEERLLINNTGAVAVNGTTWGTKRGRLSRLQMQELAVLLQDFDQFEAVYPPPRDARDDFRYLIVYGTKVVRVSDANPAVPESLRQIIQSLERLAQQLEAR